MSNELNKKLTINNIYCQNNIQEKMQETEENIDTTVKLIKKRKPKSKVNLIIDDKIEGEEKK